ncbi:MAG: hypothetical protein FJY77_02910 [Candidatus Altiarchaeales archaeon]|jgi:predicted CopG family antitoxin|nr:hypothetical protein [Candidatus Altiarchaeales archaeon]
MITTIQVDVDLLEELKSRKLFDRESYADVIRDLIEDSKELNEETKREIAKARAEIKSGRYYTLGEVKKQLGV